ncbi:MAG TPA: DUF4157 domain-containing protein [Kofleriaceae bacterium]|nr:DUF4157 domain-containing protein [Kofleriaceae bacterium]
MKDTRGPAGGQSSEREAPVQRSAGKRSRTDAVTSAGGEDAEAPAAVPGLGYLTQPSDASAVQRKAAAHDDPFGLHVQDEAARGVAGSGGALPHADVIQRSFGRHDIGGIQSHSDDQARASSQAIGAEAYATGHHVAFAGAPDLHTAAHEAAHVVQQRAGVHLKGGVGAVGDAYEQHADAVADAVVAGRSAEALLDQTPGGATSAGATSAVQRTPKISETTDTGNQYTQELDVLPTKVQIQLGIEWVKGGTWATDEAFWKFIRSCKTTVYGYLDNKFKIVGTPKGQGAQAWERPIDFLLYDIAGGYKITVNGDEEGGCAMAQAGGRIFERTVAGDPQDPVTVAHEFGHALLGQSDEYANPKLPDRPISNDHSIMGNYKTQGRAQAEFKVRHFQHILAAVSPQFPNHTCTLVKM